MKNSVLGNLTLVFAISLVLVFLASETCERYPTLAKWMGGNCWLPFSQSEVRKAVPLAGAQMLELQDASDVTDQQVLKAAIHSLGNQGSKEAREALMEIIRSDADITLRKAAIHALQNLHSDEDLVEFLADLAISEAHLELRKTAVHALGNIGTMEAQDALVEILAKVSTHTSF